jgi:hypothetical protein
VRVSICLFTAALAAVIEAGVLGCLSRQLVLESQLCEWLL